MMFCYIKNGKNADDVNFFPVYSFSSSCAFSSALRMTLSIS